jgi:putative sugar O-methyltransferase
MTANRPPESFELRDDLQLLDLMVADARKQPPLYSPGPYWAAKTRNTVNEIRRCGIARFRSSTNLIGLSYADNLLVDVRNAYSHGMRRILRWLTRTYPLGRVYDAQVRWTESYALQTLTYIQEILAQKPAVRELLKRYRLPYSLLGDCSAKIRLDGQSLSIHYLDMLERHHNLAQHVDFSRAGSVFEIGGGFGADIHMLLENYPNIRKVLYLDVPPTLYVGTQYLKAFFGRAVCDYRASRQRSSLRFAADDQLEILCIAPWQIEAFVDRVDLLMNCNSFVEMPRAVVQNYADRFSRFQDAERAAVALSTYDRTDPDSLLEAGELPHFFRGRAFERFEAQTLADSSHRDLYFVSPGKLATSGRSAA